MSVHFPNPGAANRVTQMWSDWKTKQRGRNYFLTWSEMASGESVSVHFSNAGAANRVTQMWSDWRNRLVVTKAGVEASEREEMVSVHFSSPPACRRPTSENK